MNEQRKFVTEVPENSETPLESVRSWVTPTRWFFVRNHFNVPVIDPLNWRLTVSGCVQRARTFTLEQLAAMPQHTVFATVECAGNGRSFLQPKEHGVQWGAGAIAHAEWTGVPLHLLLDDVGLTDDALELVFTGADMGFEPDKPEPIPFARGMRLDKARDGDTLLALRMNGELLQPNHGAPVRLVVPGWYGVASVKWLSRIEAVAEPFDGYFQTTKYTIERQTADGIVRVGVGRMAVKSEIIRPAEGETLAPGPQRVFGVAWAGEEAVARVEVSADGGATWDDARQIGVQAPYSWALWEYAWKADAPGDHQLMSRATSTSGETQPAAHDPLRAGYVINFVRPRPVRVEAAADVEAPVLHPGAEELLYDMNAFAEANASVPLDVEMEFIAGGGI